MISVNMHNDRRDNIEIFYCEAVLDAKQACYAMAHAEDAVHSNLGRE